MPFRLHPNDSRNGKPCYTGIFSPFLKKYCFIYLYLKVIFHPLDIILRLLLEEVRVYPLDESSSHVLSSFLLPPSLISRTVSGLELLRRWFFKYRAALPLILTCVMTERWRLGIYNAFVAQHTWNSWNIRWRRCESIFSTRTFILISSTYPMLWTGRVTLVPRKMETQVSSTSSFNVLYWRSYLQSIVDSNTFQINDPIHNADDHAEISLLAPASEEFKQIG